MLTAAEQEFQECRRGATGPQQLGGHVDQRRKGAGPTVVTVGFADRQANHAPGAFQEELKQARVALLNIKP